MHERFDIIPAFAVADVTECLYAGQLCMQMTAAQQVSRTGIETDASCDDIQVLRRVSADDFACTVPFVKKVSLFRAADRRQRYRLCVTF